MFPTNEPPVDFLFEYRGADLILRSHDSHHFRVPKIYIVNSSPVLGELIKRASVSPDSAHDETLPVVQLPESGATLHSLLTFIFPVTPLVPSTTEMAMELLSVAKKYQMASVLGHIRGITAKQNPESTQLETALYTYSLAQKYGLRPEALQAARTTLKYSMSIKDLENNLGIISGASLHELWKYHERVRANLASDLGAFRKSDTWGTLEGLDFANFFPDWLDDYIKSIEKAPNFFDIIEFNTALVRHLMERNSLCACGSIPGQTIRNFWAALTSVVHDSFEKAESALLFPVPEQVDRQTQSNLTTPQLEAFDVPDANLIIRSSDHVNFRLHKSALAMASPFFKDLFSLPQPSDSESIDGLPVVDLSEDSELLSSLVSMFYPVRPVIPNSYDKVLYLLAACQKYDMETVQSSIRAEVSRGVFPAPVGTEAFRAYAIASSNGLTPEMENAARLTLGYPMTFEILGEGLRLFEGWALHGLALFRKRCRDNFVTCLKSYLEVDAPGPSNIWVGCPGVMPVDTGRMWSQEPSPHALPLWLSQLFSQINNNLGVQAFSHPLTIHSSIREEYLKALQSHFGCNFCMGVHTMNGSTFCGELENKLALARDEVQVGEARDEGHNIGTSTVMLPNDTMVEIAFTSAPCHQDYHVPQEAFSW